MKITVGKNLKLSDVPPVIEQALLEKLTFTNPKWLENERMGRWNRRTPKVLRFYSRAGGNLWVPRGTIRQVLVMCRRNRIDCEVHDLRRTLPEVDFEFRGSLKSFQETAVSDMLKKEFGTLSAPTGSGKTVMGLFIVAMRRQPALIIVHTKDLAYQWMEQIEAFLAIQGPDLGLIGDGKKEIGNKITVALVQSLYRCADQVFTRIGHLVVDECHRTPSRTFTEAVSEFDSRYMLGLSATPWRRDRLSSLIFWHIGDVHHTVDQSRLVARGHILRAEIVARETGFEPFCDPVKEYSKMLLELTADDERNRLIASDIAGEAERCRGVCLVLSDRKKHCETLKALLRFRHGIEADLLIGDMNSEQRRHVMERLAAGKVRVLIATGQLIGEGFDCQELSTLFLATPIRFSGRVIQYLGRVLRPSNGKEKARVFDYVDVRVGVLQAAARERQKIYVKG